MNLKNTKRFIISLILIMLCESILATKVSPSIKIDQGSSSYEKIEISELKTINMSFSSSLRSEGKLVVELSAEEPNLIIESEEKIEIEFNGEESLSIPITIRADKKGVYRLLITIIQLNSQDRRISHRRFGKFIQVGGLESDFVSMDKERRKRLNLIIDREKIFKEKRYKAMYEKKNLKRKISFDEYIKFNEEMNKEHLKVHSEYYNKVEKLKLLVKKIGEMKASNLKEEDQVKVNGKMVTMKELSEERDLLIKKIKSEDKEFEKFVNQKPKTKNQKPKTKN